LKNKSGGVAIIDAIYKVYPRHIGKRAAIRAIQNAVQRLIQGETGSPMEWRQAEAFLASKSTDFGCSIAGSRGVFTPHPATWFNESRYLDDPEEWNKTTPKEEQEMRRVAEANVGVWRPS